MPYETVRSYIHRLAQANHLQAADFYTEVIGYRGSAQRELLLNPEAQRRLAHVSGRPLPELRRALPSLMIDFELGDPTPRARGLIRAAKAITPACTRCTAQHGGPTGAQLIPPEHINMCHQHHQWLRNNRGTARHLEPPRNSPSPAPTHPPRTPPPARAARGVELGLHTGVVVERGPSCPAPPGPQQKRRDHQTQPARSDSAKHPGRDLHLSRADRHGRSPGRPSRTGRRTRAGLDHLPPPSRPRITQITAALFARVHIPFTTPPRQAERNLRGRLPHPRPSHPRAGHRGARHCKTTLSARPTSSPSPRSTTCSRTSTG